MKIDRVTRRAFLTGAGGAAVALPFLPSLTRNVSAADPTQIKRFIVLNSPYGSHRPSWFPAETNRPGTSELVPGVQATRLADIAGPLSDSLGTHFDAVRDKMILLEGIDGPWGIGHQRTFPLTGYVCDLEDCSYAGLPGPSIDQIIADKAQIYDATPTHRSLTIAAGAPNSNISVHGHSLSYRDDGGSVAAVEHMYSAQAVHDVVFEGVTDTVDPAALAAFERRKGQRLSVIDRVLEDYTRLSANPRLSGRDKARVEAYLQYLREWELSVAGSTLTQCSVPPAPDESAYPSNDDLSQEQRLRDHVDNIVGAIRCGVTNVLAFDAERRNHTYGSIVTLDHHDMWHRLSEQGSELARQEMTVVDNLHMEVFGQIISQLDEVEDPETGRTFLDNSIVFVTTDQGSCENHKGHSMSCLLFGGTDVLATGNLLDYRADSLNTEPLDVQDSTVRHGRSYYTLLVSLCQAFGLDPSEYESGQQGIGDYARNGSNYHSKGFPGGEGPYETFAWGDKRTPLPGLLLG